MHYFVIYLGVYITDLPHILSVAISSHW